MQRKVEFEPGVGGPVIGSPKQEKCLRLASPSCGLAESLSSPALDRIVSGPGLRVWLTG
jgi:hypothetical protein